MKEEDWKCLLRVFMITKITDEQEEAHTPKQKQTVKIKMYMTKILRWQHPGNRLLSIPVI